MVDVPSYQRKKGKQYQLGLEPGERLVPQMERERGREERAFASTVEFPSYAYGTHDPYHEHKEHLPCGGVGKAAVAPYPHSYEEAEADLGKRDSRCVANHTLVHRIGPSGAMALKFHNTDVVIWRTDGATVLNSGGWHTMSTKDRINGAIGRYDSPGQPRFGVESRRKKGVSDWYLVKSRYDEATPEYDSDGSLLREVGGGWTDLGSWKFYDGITILPDGSVK